ncbi:hypothetical protein Thini_0188 [Thiothrix nivea DSM 5205]|uniref:Uncharacterized protein n=1 Tax=Thiothrix nivea (strain ATCC 35100 / DSM 5205 / JP2) TaxID=870187 RepID=A0A656HAI4_THINJ|nr:hypothetical protein Thini_0188 [Thiothrix nivea DSM 5205]
MGGLIFSQLVVCMTLFHLILGINYPAFAFAQDDSCCTWLLQFFAHLPQSQHTVKTCVIIDSTVMLNSSRHGRYYAV